MRPSIETRILSAYISGAECESYSISELARKTKAAYPHVHGAVERLSEERILLEKQIGRSHYCHANLENDLARNLMAQVMIRRKIEKLITPNLRNLDREIQRLILHHQGIIAVIFKDNKLLFLIDEKQKSQAILRETYLLNISFKTPREFCHELLSSLAPLHGAIVLHGYEALLLQLSPIHEQLMINHSQLFRGDKKYKEVRQV